MTEPHFFLEIALGRQNEPDVYLYRGSPPRPKIVAFVHGLQESRQQRRALFEALPTGVIVFSRDSKVVDCNAAAIDMLGMGRDQMHQLEAVDKAL